MVYALRNYVELAYIILKNGCTCDTFVYRFELSKYEYKNDMNTLKEMAPRYGIKLIVDTVNIAYEIREQAVYDQMYKLLYSCYYTNRYIFNDNDILIQMLLSRKLLNSTYLNMEEYAETIGFSKSSLRIPVKKTRDFLNVYGIHTYGKPYYGLCAEGNEFDVRTCLSDIYVKLTPELFAMKDHAADEEQFDYLYVYTAFVRYCTDYKLQLSAEDNKEICYYLSVTRERLLKGHAITELKIEQLMLERLSENGDLKAIAKEIFSYIQLEPDEIEILAFMVVLLTSNIDRQYTKYYVNTLYIEEKKEISSRILTRLKEVYHLNIQDQLYVRAMEEELDSIIIKKHTGKLVKVTERFLGRTPNVNSFPLCYFINETLKDTIEGYYHLEINRAVTETLADIVYYYIENLDFTFQKYDIIVASRFDRYAPLLLKEKLKKELDPKYIRNIDICNHFADILNHTEEFVEHYDLIITDARVLHMKNGISFSDVNNSIVRLETYLRLHRDMCSCINEGNIKVIYQNIHMSKSKKLEDAIFACSDFDLEEIRKSIRHAYTLKGILSLLIPCDGEECSLQFGDFSSPLLINNQKVNSYHIFKGKLSESNIRIINVILHELVLDPIFIEALKSTPDKSTVNEQINMIIK